MNPISKSSHTRAMPIFSLVLSAASNWGEARKLLNSVGTRNAILYVFALLLCFSMSAQAQDATSGTQNTSGQELYLENCESCHTGNVERAPSTARLQEFPVAYIFDVLNQGVMEPMASHLSEEELQEIVGYLTGQATASATPVNAPLLCENNDNWFDYSQQPSISGFGMTNTHNTRNVPADIAGLSASDVPRLKLKWAFSFPNTVEVRSQPAFAGSGLFVGGYDGSVYALDSDSGCVRWIYKADVSVRTAITIDDWPQDIDHTSNAGPLLYFADQASNAYALDAVTGELVWKTKVDNQPGTQITGSLVRYKDRLIVPSNGGEAGSPRNPEYECCTRRGSVSSLDAATGRVIWKSYVIPTEPTEQGKNAIGVAQFGPSGAGVWNTPAIDEKRNRLYVGTGENQSDPGENGTSVIAMDLDDGKILWVMNASPNEAYNGSCMTYPLGVPNGPNCPESYTRRKGTDFASPPMLITGRNGNDILIAGQKTGQTFGIDPDNGTVLWRRNLIRGDYNLSAQWGIATDDTNVFVATYDMYANPLDGPYFGVEELGIYALDLFTGEWRWTAPVSRDCKVEACRGYFAALTVIPGVVFAGSQDGYLRAFDSTNGDLIWDFDTDTEFVSVNGNIATGGTIGGNAVVVVGGNVYVNSGYAYMSEHDKLGNAFLVFSVDGE